MDSSTLKRFALAAAILALGLLAVWAAGTWRVSRPCPELLAVHVASMPEGAKAASDEERRAPYGKRVILVAVLEARDPATGETFYIAPVEGLTLAGVKIPAEKIRPSFPAHCGELRFMWYTVEKDSTFGDYRNRLRPAGGVEAIQVADVRPRDIVTADPRRPNVGSMLFRVRAERRPPGRRDTLQVLSSPDAEYLNRGGDPARLHRVTIGAAD